MHKHMLEILTVSYFVCPFSQREGKKYIFSLQYSNAHQQHALILYTPHTNTYT